MLGEHPARAACRMGGYFPILHLDPKYKHTFLLWWLLAAVTPGAQMEIPSRARLLWESRLMVGF
jgi:hypothetical protein